MVKQRSQQGKENTWGVESWQLDCKLRDGEEVTSDDALVIKLIFSGLSF